MEILLILFLRDLEEGDFTLVEKEEEPFILKEKIIKSMVKC